MASEEWGCVKLATTAGAIYIAVDERERKRFARDGRVVFTREELKPWLEKWKTWDAHRRHVWLASAVATKREFPLSVIV